MRIAIKSIPKPGNIDIELTFHATLEELKDIVKVTGDYSVWPMHDFNTCIKDAINHFYLDESEEVEKP